VEPGARWQGLSVRGARPVQGRVAASSQSAPRAKCAMIGSKISVAASRVRGLDGGPAQPPSVHAWRVGWLPLRPRARAQRRQRPMPRYLAANNDATFSADPCRKLLLMWLAGRHARGRQTGGQRGCPAGCSARKPIRTGGMAILRPDVLNTPGGGLQEGPPAGGPAGVGHGPWAPESTHHQPGRGPPAQTPQGRTRPRTSSCLGAGADGGTGGGRGECVGVASGPLALAGFLAGDKRHRERIGPPKVSSLGRWPPRGAPRPGGGGWGRLAANAHQGNGRGRWC
jgi:hypothetical protein